jgi:hypothetical protein
MKNIEIIVDVTGSCNVKEIESQLKKMQDELKDKTINANVSLWDDKELLSSDLQKLEIPFNKDMQRFMGGGNDFTRAVKSKLVNTPDTVVFIGDLCHSPLEENTFRDSPDTQLVVIQTSYEKKIKKDYALGFVKDIKDKVKTHISDVETYKSLDDILRYSIQDKIGQLRNSANNLNNNSEPKP